MTLTFYTTITHFQSMLWHIMLYQQSLFAHTHKNQTIISSEDQVKQSYCDYISPYCDLDLEDSILILLHNTPTQDDAPPYQVWIQKDEMFRGCLLDKARRTDTRRDGHKDMTIPAYPPPPHTAFFHVGYNKT